MIKNILTKPVSISVLYVCMMLLLVTSCGRVSSDSSQNSTIAGMEDLEIGAVSLSSVNDNTVIGTKSDLKIKVDLITASGDPLSGQALVNFTLSDPTLGKISSPVIVNDGSGTFNFQSKDREGIVTLIAASGETGDVKDSLDVQICDVPPPATLQISADPNLISVKGTSNISVLVLDSSGQPVVDGTQVKFHLNNESYGQITESASTTNGQASVTLSASTTSGEAKVTASAGSIAQSVSVNIASIEVGSIEFISAVPNAIGLKGSGQNEVSTVIFQVRDSNGDPVQDAQSVNIKLSGPGGGEYIEKEGQTEITVSTEDGAATIDVHSGVISGPVTLKATVATSDGTKLSTSSGVIAIGGGKPTESHFSLSASRLNLEGLAYEGIESEITVRLADRYGNIEVLEGTTVSFYSEGGGISRSAITMNNTGAGSVSFRTQDPIPHKTLPNASEVAFLNQLNSTFGIAVDTTDPDSPNPRDGLCTIIAVVDGEEEFTDSDADGKYEIGESFDDTYDDIFIDKDDNNVIDTKFEDLVIDRNSNSAFNGYNGLWDGNKKIYKKINLLITGVPHIYTNLPDGFSIPNGGSLNFQVFVGDYNYNIPIAGTSYSISVDTGKLGGTKEFVFGDTSSTAGGPIFYYTLYDDKSDDTDPPKMAEVTISISWKGGDNNLSKSLTCSGTID